MEEPRVVPCAGVVVREGRAILLVQRGHPPGEGKWSLPGGRCEPDEGFDEAAVREAREEIGVTVRLVGVAGEATIERGDGIEYLVRNYFAEIDPPAEVVAGSDADAARYVLPEELSVLDVSVGLRAWLGERGLLD